MKSVFFIVLALSFSLRAWSSPQVVRELSVSFSDRSTDEYYSSLTREGNAHLSWVMCESGMRALLVKGVYRLAQLLERSFYSDYQIASPYQDEVVRVYPSFMITLPRELSQAPQINFLMIFRRAQDLDSALVEFSPDALNGRWNYLYASDRLEIDPEVVMALGDGVRLESSSVVREEVARLMKDVAHFKKKEHGDASSEFQK